MLPSSPVSLRAAAVALLLLAGSPAGAQWYPHDDSGSASLWVGPSGLRLSSELTNPASTTTFQVGLGYRFWGLGNDRWGRLSMELVMTGTDSGVATLPLASPSYPADQASFSLIWAGLRVDLFAPSDSRFTPWLGLGYGLGALTWHTYAHMDGGLAPVLSVGADVELYGGLMLRGSYASFKTSEPRIHWSALSLSLVFEFFRPRHHWKPQWGMPAPTPPPPPPTGAPPAAPPDAPPDAGSSR
jgi:hypothetical protein